NKLPGTYYNATQHTPFYTPDLSRPAIQHMWDDDYSGRVTWQVAPTHKVTFSHTQERACFCSYVGSPTQAPEANASNYYRPSLTQATWTHPVTNRFLLQAGPSFSYNKGAKTPVGEVVSTDVS